MFGNVVFGSESDSFMLSLARVDVELWGVRANEGCRWSDSAVFFVGEDKAMEIILAPAQGAADRPSFGGELIFHLMNCSVRWYAVYVSEVLIWITWFVIDVGEEL